MRLPTPTEIRDLARRHGIRPARALGQHFLVDANTARRIVRLAGVGPEDSVVEVGAGLGMLTLALAAAARRVVAVEFDEALLPALTEVVAGNPVVEVVAADALRLDYPSVLGPRSHRMVANLPYNIATPLLATLLTGVPQIGDFFVMAQREVGERLVAGPGSRVYGAVSVLVRLFAEGRLAGRVPPTVFWPAPRVESVMVHLVRRAPPVGTPPERLLPLVRAAFSQRRKTVRNSLAAALGTSPDEVERALHQAGVPPSARAESLSLEDFARICEALGAPW